MLGGIILASMGLSTGGTAGNILFQLEQQGVFSYILPFLMIFAILYGILSKTNIFKNNGINIILSLSIALMSLQLGFVSNFFREIFPRMGVVLSLIIVTMILLGMFWDFDKPWVKWAFGIIIFIAVAVIVIQSFGDAFFPYFGGLGSSWGFGYFLERNISTIIIIALIVGGLALVIKSGKKSETPKPKKQIDMNKIVNAMTSA